MDIKELLAITKERDASDLHITVGIPPVLRLNGKLIKLNLPELKSTDIHEMIYSILNDEQKVKYEKIHELDFSFGLEDMTRFRINIFKTRLGEAAAFRLIPEKIKTLAQLGLPEELAIFTKKILNGEPIQVFNYGKMKRDFTYIDDIVEGVVRLIDKVPNGNPDLSGDKPDPGTSYAPFKIYNIGNNQSVELMHFINVLEKALGKEAKKEFLPMQAGDVPETYADINDLMKNVGFKP